MQTFSLISGIVVQVAGLVWMVAFIFLFLRPAIRSQGFTWRDAMVGVGLFLNIGAIAAIPVFCGIRLHPIVMVGLALAAFHAWMRFWVRPARQSVEDGQKAGEVLKLPSDWIQDPVDPECAGGAPRSVER